MAPVSALSNIVDTFVVRGSSYGVLPTLAAAVMYRTGVFNSWVDLNRLHLFLNQQLVVRLFVSLKTPLEKENFSGVITGRSNGFPKLSVSNFYR
jgi:hypothetical protein